MATRRPRGVPPRFALPESPKKSDTAKIPPPAPGVVRIIPFGGCEEIGKNMTAVEIGNDIIIVDMGFQFGAEDMPGVDFIIPDISYLEERKQNIRAVYITHGHLDHVGGIPYMMPRIGNPPMFTRLLTSLIIKKRQEEFPHLPHFPIEVIEKDTHMKAGNISVRFFGVTHTIPDAMGVIIETPHGNIIFTGDLKIDHVNGVPTAEEAQLYAELGKEKNLCLLMESTKAENPGFSFSERQVHENLRKIIAEVPGRLLVGTFASLLERIIFVIMTAEELGKKVAITGRSMKVNIEIAKQIGLLKAKQSTFIAPEQIPDYPPNKVVVLATGAQGDEFAALMLMANKKHKIKLQKTDTVLLSSSIVPGNEKSVQKLKDNISRQGVKIIHFRIADVHSSGHANADELLWVHTQLRPKFFIPIHGHHFMLRVHAELARSTGMPDENIVIPDNGSIIEIDADATNISTRKERVAQGVVMVDALGKGDVKDIVVRDRQVLAQDGMFVIVSIIDTKTGKIRQSPDIISRGFIYLKESQEVLRQSRYIIKKTIEEAIKDMHPINFDYVKNLVRERLGKYLIQETGKRPIIIPVLLEV